MTPNLLDELEKIVALSEKATPGKVELHTSCSWRRIVAERGRPFLVPTIDPDRHQNMDTTESAEFVVALVNWFRTHAPTLADMAKRLEALQSLAAAMYQAAGAYDMPVRFLDVLSAAGNGEPITEEQVDALLPCETPDTLQRLEAAERKATRYDYLSRRIYVEDHDGGWSSSYVFLPIPRHDGSTHKGATPYNFVTLDDAVDHAIDATQEGEG